MYAHLTPFGTTDLSMPVAAQTSNTHLQTGEIEFLRDGTRVMLHRIHTDDAAVEEVFIACVSARSRRFHFMHTPRSPNKALLKQRSAINPATDLAYLALAGTQGNRQELGMGSFSASPEGNTCEFALTVCADWHRLGLGTLLMKRLVQDARTRGISFIHSNNASDNHLMSSFAKYLRLPQTHDPVDASLMLYNLDSEAFDAEHLQRSA